MQEQAAGFLAAPADGIRHDLTGSALTQLDTLGQPDPALVPIILVLAEADKGPHFIEFQHIVRLDFRQRLAQVGLPPASGSGEADGSLFLAKG